MINSFSLKAPFPWFGGKRRVASFVWERFGDVPNYVEPFFGSGAVLLGRPSDPGIETVNDKDSLIANFWRALQIDPEKVAYYCDYPVNETDLHARHAWLVKQIPQLSASLENDPDYFDTKIAGWWCWGICSWIGRGFCLKSRNKLSKQIPHLGDGGRGIHRKSLKPKSKSKLSKQRPHLSDGGMGIHRKTLEPQDILEWFDVLSQRLRKVRVVCGDWKRIVTPATTNRLGITGVFLDPPYTHKAQRKNDLYRADDLTIGQEVAQWAFAHGNDPKLRIALCGYEGEYEVPSDWKVLIWETNGGYGNQRKKSSNTNRLKERIYFSPHCLKSQQELSLIPEKK